MQKQMRAATDSRFKEEKIKMPCVSVKAQDSTAKIAQIISMTELLFAFVENCKNIGSGLCIGKNSKSNDLHLHLYF